MRYIFALVLLGALGGSNAAEPDTYLLEYRSYVPIRDFSNTAGPDKRLLTLINTEAEWKSLWTSMEPRMSRDMSQTKPHPLPRIDFSRYSLLVAALGENGALSVSIQSVHRIGNRIRVSLIALSPGPGCVVTMNVTYPIALALIARTEKPVDFDITNALVRCE